VTGIIVLDFVFFSIIQLIRHQLPARFGSPREPDCSVRVAEFFFVQVQFDGPILLIGCFIS
jgi:hypothetical protein